MSEKIRLFESHLKGKKDIQSYKKDIYKMNNKSTKFKSTQSLPKKSNNFSNIRRYTNSHISHINNQSRPIVKRACQQLNSELDKTQAKAQTCGSALGPGRKTGSDIHKPIMRQITLFEMKSNLNPSKGELKRKDDRERGRTILPSFEGGSGLMEAGSHSLLENIDTPPEDKGICRTMIHRTKTSEISDSKN